MGNPVQKCISGFSKHSLVKQIKVIHTLENNLTESRLGGEILDSDVGMHNAN